MILPHITKTQKLILLLLYKFRFLTTNQIQKILNHRKPQPTQQLLKGLRDSGYIASKYSRSIRSENNKPAVFYLKAQSRHILKKQKECEMDSLNLIYKEKGRTKKFIEHCLTLAHIYIYFLSIKKEGEEIKFYTRTSLSGYSYFPGYKDNEMPDAYMAIKNGKETRNYFIDLFDEYTPAWVYQQRIRKYIEYSRNGDWEVNTKDKKIPTLYFVCPNETKKMFVYHYGKAKLERSMEDVTLWVSSINSIKFGTDFAKDWLEVK